ncbi:uncharacterized protein LOC135093526 isoform X2 [Scylla paramamosain]|uniref:uncharacterized protein LOC135093526 isoform X2 n=1 Tax=Scylla paramamosain TaxID=85552 RepID=UPI0030835FD0
MHDNMSGPIVIEGKFNIDRMIGSRGEGKRDFFGEAVCDVNSVGCQGILLADAMDKETNNNDWRLHEDKAFVARGKYVHCLRQHKYSASKVVSDVTDKMLHACGGDRVQDTSGY